MAVFLGLGALLWLSIDPSKKLYTPDKPEPALISNWRYNTELLELFIRIMDEWSGISKLSPDLNPKW